jgi:MinD superfamily P-loop ATPase
MKELVVINGKGGTGKTSIAADCGLESVVEFSRSGAAQAVTRLWETVKETLESLSHG